MHLPGNNTKTERLKAFIEKYYISQQLVVLVIPFLLFLASTILLITSWSQHLGRYKSQLWPQQLQHKSSLHCPEVFCLLPHLLHLLLSDCNYLHYVHPVGEEFLVLDLGNHFLCYRLCSFHFTNVEQPYVKKGFKNKLLCPRGTKYKILSKWELALTQLIPTTSITLDNDLCYSNVP